MKTFNISKEKTDALQQLYAIFTHYRIVMGMAEKEIGNYIIGNVFLDIGLKAEDFPFCNIDIASGKIDFDDEKKKKGKNEKPSK